MERGISSGATQTGGFSTRSLGLGWERFPAYPHNSYWIYVPSMNFSRAMDGAFPYAAPVFGPDGAPYGTTYYGGGSSECGTMDAALSTSCSRRQELVLRPPVYWSDKVLYAFATHAYTDGTNPESPRRFRLLTGNLYSIDRVWRDQSAARGQHRDHCTNLLRRKAAGPRPSFAPFIGMGIQ